MLMVSFLEDCSNLHYPLRIQILIISMRKHILKFHTQNSLSSLSFSLSLSIQFNSRLLYWHDKNYTFVLPKQLQLGCLQVVHICINRKKKNNNCNNNNNNNNNIIIIHSSYDQWDTCGESKQLQVPRCKHLRGPDLDYTHQTQVKGAVCRIDTQRLN